MSTTGSSVADLERAIVCAFQYADASLTDAAAQKIKGEAEMYCAMAKQTSYEPFLQLFQSSPHEQVKFYALQALQEYLNPRGHAHVVLTAPMVLQIRSELLQWLQTQHELPAYLKTKLAVVITLLVRRDYPERWPTAFHDLLSLLPRGSFMVEMYFRILIAIYEEIVEFDAQRSAAEADHNMMIKDAMREGPSACIAPSFDVIYNVLTAYTPGDRELLVLATGALETLQNYISWVDIGLVLRFVPVLFHALSNVEDLRCKAANCVYEIIAKGMLPDKKLALFASLDLLPVLSALQPALDEDPEFCEEIGEVVNGMGLELITCIDTFRQTGDRDRYLQASTWMAQLMPLTWRLFAHEVTDVSQEVFELVNALGGLLRSETPTDAFLPSSYLPQWLHGISRQIRYPDEEDEVDEAEFETYRRQLLAIFVNLARLRPDVVLQYLGTLLTDALAALARGAMPDRDIEACLCLVYRFKEGLTTIKGPHTYDDEAGPLLQMVLAVHASMLQLPTFAAMDYRPLVMYYEICVRYSALWRTHPALLEQLLSHIFGAGGVGHRHPTLRSRACYLVLRLLKSLGSAVHPHMAPLLQAIEPHLVVTAEEASALTWADQLYLFELTGFLLGSMPFNDTKLQYARVVLGPQLRLLEQCLQQPAGDEPVQLFIAHVLNAVGHLLKGFKGKACMPQQADAFAAVLATAAQVLLAYPRSPPVRAKMIFTLHRMVNLLEPDALCARADLLLVLMEHCDPSDVIEVVQLLNQLVIQYKAVPAFVQLVEASVVPFFTHLGALLASDLAPEDRASVQRHLYSYLMHLAQHRLATVLVSPRNAPAFPQVLQLVLDGFHLELHVVRAAATIVEHLVLLWFGADAGDVPQRDVLATFLLRDVVPAMFAAIQHKDMNVADMAAHSAIKDIAKCQVLLFESPLQEQFVATLQAYLAAAGVPAAIVQGYSEAVQTHDAAVIATAYKALVKASRGG
ncbi:exportin-T [Achlya hypogyna]|uniref:Exportin-T n=1 Tax=Achlya hypogyna TaxID=1202772 RepID=A0A1V9YGQ9_ACHHY|nr:exportin-T [Achlya hypogyna]